MTEHVRVLVVEDHRIVREGLCLYLARDPRFDPDATRALLEQSGAVSVELVEE